MLQYACAIINLTDLHVKQETLAWKDKDNNLITFCRIKGIINNVYNSGKNILEIKLAAPYWNTDVETFLFDLCIIY